jgi:hypothetical protein
VGAVGASDRKDSTAGDALRSGSEHSDAFEEMVLTQGLGDADRQTPRDEKGDRVAGAPTGVIMHRIWVDGTEFRWTREQAAAPCRFKSASRDDR